MVNTMTWACAILLLLAVGFLVVGAYIPSAVVGGLWLLACSFYHGYASGLGYASRLVKEE